jgi:hypothetical protein
MTECCGTETSWRTELVEGRLADVQRCGGCEAALHLERFVVPLDLPLGDACLDCSGTVVDDRCRRCGEHVAVVQREHEVHAQVHSSGNLLVAAQWCDEQGRHLLALKLATAALRDPDVGAEAHRVRIAVLASIGEAELACAEAAWRTRQPSAATADYLMLADLSKALGDRTSALRALRRALGQASEPGSLWAELAELEQELGNGLAARAAAVKGVREGSAVERCAAYLGVEVERLFRSGRCQEAVEVCELAGEQQFHHSSLAWVRCLAARGQADRLFWARATLAAAPGHREAEELLAAARPTRFLARFLPW